MKRWQHWAAGVAVTLTLASCGIDPQQTQICRRVVGAFEETTDRIEILREADAADDANSVVIDYRAYGPGDRTHENQITCRFGGGDFDVDRFMLTGITGTREGVLSDIKVHMVRLWLRLPGTAGPDRTGTDLAIAGDRENQRIGGEAAYLLQQAVNAIVPGCIYGLLAIGFTLVYAIIGRVNLAFGELAMIGAFAAILGVTAVASGGFGFAPLALLAVLVFAGAVGGLHGWVTHRAIFRPLSRAPSQAFLVASIGLAVFLQEYVRLVQGSRDRWIQPVFTQRVPIVRAGQFEASISASQIIILGLTVTLFATLALALKKSRFGRNHRACADDAGMAALVGIDVHRTVAQSFVVGATLAAGAGFIMTLYYGGVNFFMGHMIGFKALTAAIVGGIGSVPGAMLGGFAIGLFESLWAGYLTIAYRDIAIFMTLAAVLIFRPQGLLGVSTSRGD